MYFFESLIGIFKIGFKFFAWFMRYPIAEDFSFGQALVFFTLLVWFLSFVLNFNHELANNYKLGSTKTNNKGGND